MTEQEHLIDRDQKGEEIHIEIDAIDGMRVLNLDFPIPSKPLNILEFRTMRIKVNMEMIEYIKTHRPPRDPFQAARVLADKMKEVLTKHYKSMGVL